MAIGSVIGINNSKSNSSEELALSSYYGIVGKNSTITFTVTTSSDDPIYAISSDTNIATTAVNNETVSVRGIAYGNVIITVMQENTSSNKTFLCTVTRVGSTLTSTNWNTISEISREGTGDSYWDIGDTKSITLSGTIGINSFGLDTNVFILHFNYPMNGVAENNIIWGGFTDSNGKDIALVDYLYPESIGNGTRAFTMNHWTIDGDSDGNNYGGWKGSDFRYDILGATSIPPSDYGSAHTTACIGYDATSATLTNPKGNTLLAALPSDFIRSLRLWSRWIDAVGNNSNIDANIKETVDAVTLLAEFEVLGSRCYANPYEQNHQSQMEYYRLGNSRIRYNQQYDYDDDYHDSSSYSVLWWLASPYSFIDNNVSKVWHCVISSTDSFDGGGNSGNCAVYWSMGVAPAFKT